IYFYEDSSTIYFYDFLANGIHSTNNHLNASNSNETNESKNNTMGESKLDSNESKNNIIQTILFNPNPNNTQNLPCINSFYKSQSLITKSFTQSTHSATNPYELHSISSHFNPNNATSHNDSYNNSIENLNNALYSTHIYNSQYSFSDANNINNPNTTNNQNPQSNPNNTGDISSNINTPLSIATSRAMMLYNTFKAKSNIYDLELNQTFRINLEHSTSTKEQSLQDFYIIEIKQMLINEALLANNINTNDNIIHKSNAFFNAVLLNDEINDKTQTNHQINNQANILDSQNLLFKDLDVYKSNPYSNTLTLLPINISFTPNPKAKPLSPS
ncbi:hypothetical protein ACWIUO_13760, partial [Helicobacter sp. T3_23-1056]